MRKIVGALILLTVAVLHRADDISRFRVPVETPVLHSAPVARLAPAGAPIPKKGGRTPRVIPPDYKRNPLLFFSTAPKDSLVLLPGIGPVLADRIIKARSGKRSFTRWNDLLAIKGIGPKTVDRLKRLAEKAETP